MIRYQKAVSYAVKKVYPKCRRMPERVLVDSLNNNTGLLLKLVFKPLLISPNQILSLHHDSHNHQLLQLEKLTYFYIFSLVKMCKGELNILHKLLIAVICS